MTYQVLAAEVMGPQVAIPVPIQLVQTAIPLSQLPGAQVVQFVEPAILIVPGEQLEQADEPGLDENVSTTHGIHFDDSAGEY